MESIIKKRILNNETTNNEWGTIVNISPDMIVMIYGAIIEDIASVSFNLKLDPPSTITITLVSPNHRYVITENNLRGFWREDERIKRMVYETKFRSGIELKEGVPVFDIGDPVRVFLKGRYHPYYQLAFTGFVHLPTTTTSFGSSEQITLTCEDVTRLLRFSFSDTNPSMSIATRKIFRNKLLNDEEKSEYQSTFTGNTLEVLLKKLVIGKNLDPSLQEKMNKADDLTNDSDFESLTQLNEEYKKLVDKRDKIVKDIAKFEKSLSRLKKSSNSAKKIDAKIKQLKRLGSDIEAKMKELSSKMDPIKARLKNKIDALISTAYEDFFHERIGAVGYFQYVPYFYKDKKSPKDILYALENGISVKGKIRKRSFPTSYYIDKNTSILVPNMYTAITFSTWNPYFTKDDIYKIENLPKIWKLSKKEDWKRGNVSPDMAIKGEVSGLWNNSLTLSSFNPRFYLIGFEKIIKEEKLLPGAYRNFSLTENDIKNKLSIIKEVVQYVDFRFFALPTGDIICEPFWDNTSPWDWFDEKHQSWPLPIKGTLKIKDGQAVIIQRSSIDHPLIIEKKETLQKSRSVSYESLYTFVAVEGDNNGNSEIKINYDPSLLKLKDIQNKGIGLAYGWYVADGFEKVVTSEFFEPVNSFNDMKKYLYDRGIYDPNEDLVSSYGFNELEKKTRIINNDTAADMYAKILFRRYYGDSKNIGISFLYKPEMITYLGKPIFDRTHKLVGILQEISFSFQFGGTINFSASLKRIKEQLFLYNATKTMAEMFPNKLYSLDDRVFTEFLERMSSSDDLLIFRSIGFIDPEKVGLISIEQSKKSTEKPSIAEISAHISLRGISISCPVEVSSRGDARIKITKTKFDSIIKEDWRLFDLARELQKYNKYDMSEHGPRRTIRQIISLLLEMNPIFEDPTFDLDGAIGIQSTYKDKSPKSFYLPITIYNQNSPDPNAFLKYIKVKKR